MAQLPGVAHEAASTPENARVLSAAVPGTWRGLPQVPSTSLSTAAAVPVSVPMLPPTAQLPADGQDTASAEPAGVPTVFATPTTGRAACQVPFLSSATNPPKVCRVSAS